MRRILLLGAALLLAVPQLRADAGPRPGPGQFPPQPAAQAAKAKISIEIDEKATEPRLLVPIQVMFGGGFGAGGVLGGPPPGVFGQAGGPPANFGMQGGPPANFGMQGGPPA